RPRTAGPAESARESTAAGLTGRGADRLPIQPIVRAVDGSVRHVHPAAVAFRVDLLVPDREPRPSRARARNVTDIAAVGNGAVPVHFAVDRGVVVHGVQLP